MACSRMITAMKKAMMRFAREGPRSRTVAASRPPRIRHNSLPSGEMIVPPVIVRIAAAASRAVDDDFCILKVGTWRLVL